MCMAYSKMRNLDEKPYSREEAEVAKYLMELAGIGGGDDPVGFLIVSHRELARQRALLRTKYPAIFHEIAYESGDETQRVEPLSRELFERINRLAEGVSSDPDESLGDEDLL